MGVEPTGVPALLDHLEQRLLLGCCGLLPHFSSRQRREVGAACEGLSGGVLWNLGWSGMEKLCRAVFQTGTVKCKDDSFAGDV